MPFVVVDGSCTAGFFRIAAADAADEKSDNTIIDAKPITAATASVAESIDLTAGGGSPQPMGESKARVGSQDNRTGNTYIVGRAVKVKALAADAKIFGFPNRSGDSAIFIIGGGIISNRSIALVKFPISDWAGADFFGRVGSSGLG